MRGRERAQLARRCCASVRLRVQIPEPMGCRMWGPSAGKQTGVPRASWQAGLTTFGEFWGRLRDPVSMAKVERDQGRILLSILGVHVHAYTHVPAHTCTQTPEKPPPTHTHTHQSPLMLLTSSLYVRETGKSKQGRHWALQRQAVCLLRSEFLWVVQLYRLHGIFPDANYTTFNSLRPFPLCNGNSVQWV